MAKKPTYEELEQRVKGLEKEVFKRKQAEEALKESRNAYKTTFETTGTAMLIGEEDTTISMINVEFEKLCGYSKEEVEGKKSWIEFIVKADLERMKGYHNLRMIDPNAAPPYYEFQFIDKHGNVRYCLITLALIPGTKKTVGSLIDITECKQDEDELLIERDNLRNIFESMEDGIYIVNQEYDIQYVNSALVKDFGPYEGIKCYKYFHDRDEVCPWCKNQDVWAGKTVRWEWYSFKNEKTYDLIDTPMTLPDGSIGKLEIFRDITDMKQAEETLKESEEKYRTLSEQSTDAIYITTHKGKLAYVNQSFLDLFGYTREEITDMKAQEMYVNADDRSMFQQEIEKTGSVRDFEVKLHKKAGAEMDCLITATVRQADDRSILGYQGIIRDITEQKASLEMWRRYEFIVNTSGQFMTLINRDYTYEAVNEAYSISHKKSRDEILGMTVADIWGDETFNTIIKPYIDKCLAGNEVHYQTWFEFKGQEPRFYDVSYYPYYGKEKDVTHAVVVTHDITEQKQAEDALKKSEKKYRTILESIEEGYYEVDIAGNFTFFNDSICKILGYTNDELMGMNNRQYTEKESAKRLYQTFNRVYKTGKSTKIFDWEIVRKDTTKSYVETSVSLMKDAEGNPAGFRGIVRDITEKKNLEAQLIQAQKMEAIGTLAGGIAHNFNNLLMSIQGNTSLMLLDTDSNHPHYQRLTNIEKLVQSGSKLTSQLLGYARGGRYEVKPISMNQIIKETSATFSMTKKDITIHQDLNKDLYGVKADLGQIEQVLLNIYVNAAEAMPGGGELFLHTINVTHKDIKRKPYKVKPREYILLTIRDTGIGMDKKTKDKVFDPFFTTKGLAKGTGLGLASVYGIIKAHGGYIDVESKKGHGTTFYIYLPATKAEGIAQRAESESGVEILEGKETVLLVDDEEIIIDVGQELLKTLGYKVLIAEGGREAVDIYKTNKERIDIVILDMIMPVIGGGEAYDRMKGINPNIKVLLSSGYSINGQATEILKRGCDGFIQKPFTMKELSKAIREVLGKK